ncbi:uncharacterized protein JN550_000140 [Neoarthrinium moseri]|uniref:uncharacterized protein n=1 Tax=Neoarthrinium moseri TaxID=1658444 RepID=UPI001FDBC93C|nr:uncharacterized protein JN550_000140 [Neoarthrinium moseri]KAI1877958.1 hypothetical protein JN550_000140 [Neoarthrinium moseri]
MKLKNLSHIDKEGLLQITGTPEIEELRLCLGGPLGNKAPRYLVRPADLSQLATVDEVAIINFGGAFDASSPPDFMTPLPSYSSPEILNGNRTSFPSDVWALGCKIAEIRAGQPLYDGSVGLLKHILGPIPQHSLCLVEEYEDEIVREENAPGHQSLEKDDDIMPLINNGNPLDDIDREKAELVETGFCTNLQLSLAYLTIPQDEVYTLAELLERIFKYDPEERLSLNTIIDHE